MGGSFLSRLSWSAGHKVSQPRRFQLPRHAPTTALDAPGSALAFSETVVSATASHPSAFNRDAYLSLHDSLLVSRSTQIPQPLLYAPFAPGAHHNKIWRIQ
jgi:hypothetical protein